MRHSAQRYFVLTSLVFAALIETTAAQEAFPVKPVIVVRPTAPGGSDGPLRLIAQKASEFLKQQVLLESRPGGGGNIAAIAVKQAARDGYTLMLGHPGTLAINQSLHAKLPYDPIRDFQPVALITSYPMVMLVPASSGITTVAQLRELGRKKPGGLNFGSPGNGTTPHLIGEMMKVQSGITMQHIPYKGAAPALTDLVAGRLDFYFTGLSTATPFVKDGRLRIIATTSPQRSEALPTVETLTEAGFRDIDFGNWQGVVAPQGTPQAVVNRLHQAFAHAIMTDEVRTLLKEQALDAPVHMSPEQFGQLIKSDAAKFEKVIKAAGVQGDS